jgi:CRISPR system Cascade subunit CasA
MTYSFNLIDQPWIPCTKLDGRMEELNLRETLARSHELRGVQGDSPLETASLYRLLLAVIHSSLRGPKAKKDWVALWNAKQFDMSRFDKYFKEWHSRFDLFDKERPFYQVKNNKDGRQKISNDVLPDVASGANSTLFSHATDENNILLTSSKAARTLLVMQTFSVAGGWGMAPRESSDAPWGRGIIFLVEGDTLFQTLLLNLLKYPDNDVMPVRDEDKPAWEMDEPFKPKREQPLGYLDSLTWQNRRVSLIPIGEEENPLVQEMIISQGLVLAPNVLDPMKHYWIDKKEGFKSNRFAEEKVLWRDSSALFRVRNSTIARPPAIFLWLSILADDDKIDMRHSYRFMALGMATKGDAKIGFYRHENFPLHIKYLQSDKLLERLSGALIFADKTNEAVKYAGKLMAFMIVSKSSDEKIGKIPKEHPAQDLFRHWGAERFFWSRLEVPFYEFLQTLPDDESVLDYWNETLQQTAWDALRNTTRMAGESTKALKAAVRAEGVLRNELKKLFEEIQLQQEIAE